jgi:ABC-type multidrug transport system fused ATPase/permease subunit
MMAMARDKPDIVLGAGLENVTDESSAIAAFSNSNTAHFNTTDKEEEHVDDNIIHHALLCNNNNNNNNDNEQPPPPSSPPPATTTTTTMTKSKPTTTIMTDNARRTVRKRETILGALVRKKKLEQRDERSPEADIVREISQTIGAAGARSVPFEVRIKNGSYTVKSPVADAGEKIGQQFIPTVTNSRALVKIARDIWDLVTSGSYQRKTETKSVLEDVNLYLEGGKTYLILGAPGSGKSTRE